MMNYNEQTYPSLKEFIQSMKEKGTGIYGHRLEFAHEVDGNLLRLLESSHLQSVMNKLLDYVVNLQMGKEYSENVVIDSQNYPDLYQVLEECCETLEIPIPRAMVSTNEQGINAYASGSVDNPVLVIGDLATHLLTQDELRFIIGHECGHLAMEHCVYHMIGQKLTELGELIPVIGKQLVGVVALPLNTWSRYSEITADRAGLICCKDLATSMRALLKIKGGFSNTSQVDLNGYIDQCLDTLTEFRLGSLGEYLDSHPLIPKRLRALQLFDQSELYHRVTGRPVREGMLLMPDDVLKKSIDDLLTVMK